MSSQPTAAAARSAEPRRFEELEAYRGIAALCIIVFHAYQHSPQLAAGLPAYPYEGTPLHALFLGLHLSGVFFALSGFLLFLPFARAAIELSGPRSARGFLVKRLIRILPLYYLTLLIVWAWRFVGQPEQVSDLLLHLSFTHVFHPTYIFWTLGPAWSLAVEVHFYLLLAACSPLLYRLCARFEQRGRRVALLAALVGLLIAASGLYKWWAFNHPAITPESYPVFYSLPAKLDALGLGMLLALLVAARRSATLFRAPLARLLQLLGFSLIALSIMLESVFPLIALYFSTLVALGTTMLISSTVLGPRGSWLERAFCLPAPQFLGTISYGLYLLHEPLMIELGRAGLLLPSTPLSFPLTALSVIALAVAAATLCHHLIERPFGELRHLFDGKGRLIERYPAAPPAAPALSNRRRRSAY